MNALELFDVSVAHGTGRRAREILSPISLSLQPGESVAVVGRSGAGKSTLASVALGLRRPTTGTVIVGDREWRPNARRPTQSGRRLVQGVPQDPMTAFHPRWTLRRSIETAVRRLTGDRDPEPRIRRAAELASIDVRLLDRRPTEISGGQAQRAAIARALSTGPAVLVADEPTSALDPSTASEVSSALLGVTAESDVALLLVTHDPSFAGRCDRVVEILAPGEH